MTKRTIWPGLGDGVTKLLLFERKQAKIVNFANFIIDNAPASHCSARLSVCANESWSLATTIKQKVPMVCEVIGALKTTIAKSAIGLRGFIGALKNGQSTKYSM